MSEISVMPDVNSNLDHLQKSEVELENEIFSDGSKYCYAALCSLALHHLYSTDPEHREFSEGLVKDIRRHLNLPSDQVMLALFRGEGCVTEGHYVDLIRREGHAYSFLIVKDLIYHSVKGGKYDARTRALILAVSKFLDIRSSLIEMMEESAVKYITEEIKPKTEDEEKENTKRQKTRKIKRYALIGLATLGGGAILGLTGGLAAPLIGAGVGSVLGGATAAALGSTVGATVIGSLFGVAGAGLSGFKMQKRVGDVEEFAFKKLGTNKTTKKNLHVVIAISGWLTDESGEQGFWLPWKNLKLSEEQYCLQYESEYLLELGRAIDYLLSFAVSMAAQEALKLTILSGLISAITWPASLLTLASVLDNPWGVCCRRSAQIGRYLADVLMSRKHGNRPVTLIGLSLGARVVFYCLLELSQRKDSEGIVLDAIMLGAPVSGRASNWKLFSRVVARNIVNGYNSADWLLKFLYRSTTGHYRIAGLEPVTFNHPRMSNVDLSSIISGHTDYAKKAEEILLTLGYSEKTESLGELLKKSHSCHNLFNNEGDSYNQSLTSSVLVSTSSNSTSISSKSSSTDSLKKFAAKACTPSKFKLTQGLGLMGFSDVGHYGKFSKLKRKNSF